MDGIKILLQALSGLNCKLSKFIYIYIYIMYLLYNSADSLFSNFRDGFHIGMRFGSYAGAQ